MFVIKSISVFFKGCKNENGIPTFDEKEETIPVYTRKLNIRKFWNYYYTFLQEPALLRSIVLYQLNFALNFDGRFLDC